MKRVLPIAFYFASTWSLFIVLLVVLNVDWALPRAAGGQFDSFPTWLRILYLFNFSLLTLQVIAYIKKRMNLIKIFFWISSLSTIVNLASRSPLERWNAAAAALTALSLFVLIRDSRKV
jgi:hypothetical protein